ncbi:MAG TPA: MlaD family protein [Polyangiaceae bacterium]|nr:MlaD family protein [Polyangiaceae bacterium]
MATGTNRWKLGLFVMVGAALTLAGLIAFGARSFSRSSARYVSYFDESVQGLDVGSAAKFRGVPVGRVAAIEIAPDQRHIEIGIEIDESQLQRLLSPAPASGEGGKSGRPTLHPDLRAQLGSAGITGLKFVLLDYFDPARYPPPALPFQPPPNYIPAVPSLLQNLEDSVRESADQLPDMASAAARALTSLEAILSEVDRGRLPERAAESFTRASGALGALERELRALDAAGLSRDTRRTLASFDATLARANGLLDRLDGDRGLLASAQRSLEAFGDVAQGAQSLGGGLDATLRDLRGAARSLQRFLDALERDPDMLLKGRAARAR